MAQLTAAEIFAHAVAAGFSPDQATTMTAIALAESGGNTGSLNDSNEYSVGLWQINLDAHAATFAGWDLTDPAQNARAAFEVSGGGKDISPWTVTHLSRDARYRQFQPQALEAARLNAHGDVVGNFGGTQGYGHPASAGSAEGAVAFTPTAPVPLPEPPMMTASEGETPLERFLKLAVAQEGDPYDSAHLNVDLDDPDPDTLDCSELVEWAASMSGTSIVDGSWLQYFDLVDRNGEMSVEEALRTPGALLFRFDPPPTRGGGRPGNKAHVAISLGDGRTIEAMGSKYGIVVGDPGANWTQAGMIPEFRGQHVDIAEVESWRGRDGNIAELLSSTPSAGSAIAASPTLATETLAAVAAATDTDHDGLTDQLESLRGWDPNSRDADRDGMSDIYEVLEVGSSPVDEDTDDDGTIDSIERLLGRNPLVADSTGAPAPSGAVDSDRDGVADDLERRQGLDPYNIDSDHDGFTDLVDPPMASSPSAFDDSLPATPSPLDPLVEDD